MTRGEPLSLCMLPVPVSADIDVKLAGVPSSLCVVSSFLSIEIVTASYCEPCGSANNSRLFPCVPLLPQTHAIVLDVPQT